MPRLYRYLLFAALFAAIGYVSWDLGRNWSRAYERMLVARIGQGLQVLDLHWVRVQANGLQVRLHGHAPDAFARNLALDSARATASVARISDYMTHALAAPAPQDPVRVELNRDERGTTLTGQFAGDEMRARMQALLAEAAPTLATRDLTGIQARRPPGGMATELAMAAAAAAALPNAAILVEPGRVRIEGQARNAGARRALEQRLAALATDRVTVEQDVRIPLGVIAPFTFAAVREVGGRLRLEACAARDAGERADIAKMLAARGITLTDAACPVGLGGPLDDWAGAIGAGLDALDRLPAGRFELEYRAASLTGYPPTAPHQVAALADSFAAAMPEGFETATHAQGDDAATRAEIARTRYWMRLTHGPDGVALAGRVPDSASATALGTYAAALFGQDRVQVALSPLGTAPPAGWQPTAMAMLDLMRASGPAQIELANRRIVLAASAATPEEAHDLHRAARARAGGYALHSRIRVAAAEAYAAIPLPGPICAERLNRLVLADPVEFEIGSAVIAAGSEALLDRLAAIIGRCDGATIEVGGHTDADGAADYNQRLSDSRADAVRRALIRRGAPAPALVARGYGEDDPIASNATPEGRARNRRIEFRHAG